jgi:hypothetical protein
MIPGREAIGRAVQGALLLARGDSAGMGLFDTSFDGFWHSFAAPVLAAPIYALLLAEQYARFGYEGGLGTIVLAESVSYILDILTFPILAIFLTKFLNLGARYVPLVVATNWATLPQVLLFLAAVTLGTLVAPLRPALLLFAMLATLTYQWFVVRTALGSTGGHAAAFVTLNLLVGLLLNRVADTLLQTG